MNKNEIKLEKYEKTPITKKRPKSATRGSPSKPRVTLPAPSFKELKQQKKFHKEDKL